MINHYTVNSQHSRVSLESEVNKDIKKIVYAIAEEAAQKGTAEVIDSTELVLTIEEDAYMATLTKDDIPILITAGASTATGRDNILEEMKKLSKAFLVTKALDNVPAHPVIMDLISPFAVGFPQILEWSGDFSRCLGHTLLGKFEKR